MSVTPARQSPRHRPRPRLARIAPIGLAFVAAFLIGPGSAAAGIYDVDENGNTTPAGHPECTDCPEPSGDETGGVSTTADDVDESHDCTWLVTGRLIVRDPTLDGVEDRDPIAGVKVKVSGASVGKFYNSWGTDITDADGEFSVSETACARHDVKVEVKFKSDDGDLRVKGPASPTWYEIYETVDKIEASDLDLNGEPFGSGYGSGDAATTQGRIDAQTWIVHRKAIDYLDDIGRSALNDTVVNNPASLAAGDSWADPVLHEIHIIPRDTYSLDTMLHEFAHTWAYPRERGEDCLIGGLPDTHEQFENPCVAFNEGFAEFFSDKLELELNAENVLSSSESPQSVEPWKRAELVSCSMCDSAGLPRGLVSFGSLEQSEYGWQQVFRVLTSSDLTRQVFGDGTGGNGYVGSYSVPGCSDMPIGQDDLADALYAFGTDSDKIDVQDPSDPSVAGFLDRAKDRLSTFDDWDELAYLNTIDPTSDSEPHEAYGC